MIKRSKNGYTQGRWYWNRSRNTSVPAGDPDGRRPLPENYFTLIKNSSRQQSGNFCCLSAAAGIITLITIVTSRHETVQLSYQRVMTFFLSVALACVIFQAVPWAWADYGIYIFVMAIICQLLNWDSTISLNAVIGTHFLVSQDFSLVFILNEFSLVLIGIIFAILLNFYPRAPKDSG